MRAIRGIFGLALVLGLFSPRASAAVTFTITPSTVSNTYAGTVSLLISNVPTGDPVVVQKFLDLNTNGVINGSDWLVQQFTVTDGQASVIGGVTNFNVPGDLNTATGAITATLDFQNGDFTQTIIGKYAYKISSPSGHFTPVTNFFTVTNFNYAQKFTGNVLSNRTSTVVSNAVIVVFPAPKSGGDLGMPVAGAVANNAGAYTVQLPPGTYLLLPVRSNFVANASTAPVLALGGGQTITTNLSLTNATASITGKVVDAATNSIGLPGIFMAFSSTNGLVAVTSTDTNGNFTARVTSGKWQFGDDDSGLIIHGYVGLNNGTNASSGATGITLAYHRATALFYGSVKDSSGNPLPGVDVSANDENSNIYYMDSYTDPNGNYAVGVVGGLNNDPWQIQIGNGLNPALTNYVFSTATAPQNGGVSMATGQSYEADIFAILGTSQISGHVQDSAGNAISGVQVDANADINGTNYFPMSVDTDVNGNYLLTVPNGYWDISVSCDGGDDSLSQLGNYACPDDQFADIIGNNATNNFTVQICGGVSITTPSLPAGEAGVYYDQTLQASSCNGSYSWSLLSGAGALNSLGLTFSSNGEIYGTPANAVALLLNVQVTDVNNNLTTNQTVSFAISNAMQVTTTSLPNAVNGLNYRQQLQLTGGVPPYDWYVVSGAPPANVNLSSSGLLSGIVAATGNFNFTAEVSDAAGAIYDQPLSLTVNSTNYPPLTVAMGGGQVVVLWPASGGTNFTLETTTNLATGPWVPATNGVPAVSFIFTNAAPAAFFRLQ